MYYSLVVIEGRMEKVVVITGVSKGLGKALAEEFKSNGFTVVGISRSEVDFVDFHISTDLTNKEDIRKVQEEVIKKFNKIDVLINNAGVGLYDSWENMKEEQLRYMFELNFFSVVNLTKQFLPYLKKTKGSVINVSSVAGKMYIPYMGGYCATKFALNAFSDSLRAEIKTEGVHVLNLIVGRINTGFSSRALGSKKPPSTPSLGASPNKFAKSVFKAYKNKKRELTFPVWYKPLIWIANLFPNLYDKITYKKWNS